MTQRSLRLCPAPARMLFLAALVAGAQAVGAQVPVLAGDEIQVNDGPTEDPLAQQVAVFSDGGFAVVWATAAGFNLYELHARCFAADDGTITDELVVLPAAQQTFQPVQAAALLADTADNLLLVYQEEVAGQPLAVFAQRLSHLAAPVGPPIQVSAPSPFRRRNAAAAATPHGRVRSP